MRYVKPPRCYLKRGEKQGNRGSAHHNMVWNNNIKSYFQKGHSTVSPGQANKGTEKIEYRALSEIALINTELKISKDMICKIDQDRRKTFEYIHRKVYSIRMGMLSTSRLEY